MDYYVERMINDSPTKITNNDMVLNTYGNNVIEKVNRKRLLKKTLESSILQYKKECLYQIHQPVAVFSTRVK